MTNMMVFAGISVCGSGVGTFIFAPLATWLLEQWVLDSDHSARDGDAEENDEENGVGDGDGEDNDDLYLFFFNDNRIFNNVHIAIKSLVCSSGTAGKEQTSYSLDSVCNAR